MKDVEIFYFDVDGTLLDNVNHKISESTKSALKQLKEKGYKVALCTGRNLEGIKDLDIIDLIEWDAYVLANGSQILDHKLNLLDEITFDKELIHKLDKAITGPLLLEGDINFITKESHEKLDHAFKHFGTEPYPVKAYDNEKVFNLICYDFDQIKGDLLQQVLDTCEIFDDQLGNKEIINIDSGKHNGVQRVNDILNVSHYAGFGDGENDVKFLQNAPISVAMGNGCENVKTVASHITDSVDNDGILKALQHYGVL